MSQQHQVPLYGPTNPDDRSSSVATTMTVQQQQGAVGSGAVDGVVVSSASSERAHKLCEAYMRGQLANVAKAAVWWSTFGVVAQALTQQPMAVGISRFVFNIALVMVSPIAGSLAETVSIRSLLSFTTLSRFVIWCILLPSTYVYFVLCTEMAHVFYITFLILMFVDGIQVSFANVVDIDCGGLDSLSSQYKLSISNYLRDRFSRIHQSVFDLSFILVTPPIAFLIWRLGVRSDLIAKTWGDLVGRVSHEISHMTHSAAIDVTTSAFSPPMIIEMSERNYHLSRLPLAILMRRRARRLQQQDFPLPTPLQATTLLTPPPPLGLGTAATQELPGVTVLMIGVSTVFGLLSFCSLYYYCRYLTRKAPSESDVTTVPPHYDPMGMSTDASASPNPPPYLRNHPSSEDVSSIQQQGGAIDGNDVLRGGAVSEDPVMMATGGEVGSGIGNSNSNNVNSGAKNTFFGIASDRFRDVREGAAIVMKESALRWRLLFLAFETALEDAVVSVVLPQCAIYLFPILLMRMRDAIYSEGHTAPYQADVATLPGGWTCVNFVAVLWIAIGKAGGFVSSALFQSQWTPADTVDIKSYKKLFRWVFWGASSLFLLPLSYFLLTTPDLAHNQLTKFIFSFFTPHTVELVRVGTAAALLVLASLLFFVLSTAPKVGFATLLHFLIIQRNVDAKIFGFVGTFVTLTDALVILGLSAIFANFGVSGFKMALMVTAVCYVFHGLTEVLFGSHLILKGGILNAASPLEYSPSNYQDDDLEGAYDPADMRNEICVNGRFSDVAGHHDGSHVQHHRRSSSNSQQQPHSQRGPPPSHQWIYGDPQSDNLQLMEDNTFSYRARDNGGAPMQLLQPMIVQGEDKGPGDKAEVTTSTSTGVNANTSNTLGSWA